VIQLSGEHCISIWDEGRLFLTPTLEKSFLPKAMRLTEPRETFLKINRTNEKKEQKKKEIKNWKCNNADVLNWYLIKTQKETETNKIK
jgi:hypothetical protein